jgi:hypothetical protein
VNKGPNKRPSHKELSGKLKEAQKALGDQDGLFAEIEKAFGELNELEIGDAEEVWSLIRLLLCEIGPTDYEGSHPPQKSYEKAILGEELFAFAWHSSCLSRRMYLKFALKSGRFYYVSLHKERPKKGGKS